MSEKQINLAGVKFKPSEITSVTIRRDGHEITLTPKQSSEPQKIGFK